eukprot:GFUD01022085.1.p1 GENE.GFUD01022085.1~~GFUD01022085.1.p1  ORF type:complete len:1165 (+),score=332.33 GFUD01022085.1:40-3534(+)
MENKGDIENQSDVSQADTKLRVVTKRGGARLQLSPHSHNVPDLGRKSVHFETKVEEGGKIIKGLKKWRSGGGGTVSGDEDTRSKENVGDGGDNSAELEKKNLPRASIVRKRSYSFSDGHIKHPTLPPIKRWKPGRSGGGRGRGAGGGGGGGTHIVHPRPPGSKNVLPSKFLLGGNINDPLNLNSLNDERIARVVNAVTPESSPLPTPKHRKEEYKIEVLIPPNISDPLNLNAEDDSDYEAKLISPLVKKKKVRHRKRPKKPLLAVDLANLPGPKPEVEEGNEGDISETDEEGASSVKPKSFEKFSDPEEDSLEAPEVQKDVLVIKNVEETVDHSKPNIKNDEEADLKCGIIEKQNLIVEEPKEDAVKIVEPKVDKRKAKKLSSNFNEKNEKFQYGNYNQYYGYRNPGKIEDGRLQYFKASWFEDKDVLDIGCNIGHITISIAKNNKPSKIVGVDIDKKLIDIARKNVRYYLDTQPDEKTRYPRKPRRSFPLTFGPLDPGQVSSSRSGAGTGSTGTVPTSIAAPAAPASPTFPNNIQFFDVNYVLDCDELLETVVPEFDTILCLSTTKWIHLNFGDDGLKRVFRRIYAQLKPGGTFVLECQSFSTYRKKKKLTEAIFNNFKNIKLKPENFTDFLIHEVGFSRSEVLALPAHHSKGFQRPLQIFTKVPPSSNISASTTPYSFGISPHCYNPSFTPFYGKITPGYTPRYSQPGAPADPPLALPTPLYSGPTPPMYYGPTPGGYSANSTPSHSTPGYQTPESLAPPPNPQDPPGFTPRYTPSYTPAHPQYSPGITTPGTTPHYSPGNATPAPTYSPYTPDPPVYSPSAVYSPTPGYSPSAGYSPTPSGPSYSPGPLYSPGNATPRYSPAEPAYSPSIQGHEVSGNTTPHPGHSGSPGSSPGPRYSWAGGVPGSGGNTPQHNGGNTPQGGVLSSAGNTPQYVGGNTPTVVAREGGSTPLRTVPVSESNTGNTPRTAEHTGSNTPQGSDGSGSTTPVVGQSGGNTPLQAGGNTPHHVGENTLLQPRGNTPHQAGANTPLQAGGNTPQQVGGNTPKQTGGGTPLQAGGNTPHQVGGGTPHQAGGNTPHQAGINTPLQSSTTVVTEEGEKSPSLHGGSTPVSASSSLTLPTGGPDQGPGEGEDSPLAGDQAGDPAGLPAGDTAGDTARTPDS